MTPRYIKENRTKPWQRFMARMIGRTQRSNSSIYVIRGRKYYNDGWWCETTRHVRHTVEGIIKQGNQDNCMNHREVQVFEVDFDRLVVRRIYGGRISKSDG